MQKWIKGVLGVLLASGTLALLLCGWRWFRRGIFCTWAEWQWLFTILVILGCFGLLFPSEESPP